MKVLVGSTNPSKVQYFQTLLAEYTIQWLSLADFSIAEEPEENGVTPVQNACIKAAFYGRYFDLVICNDAGLYFDELSLEDPRQPALRVRTPQGSDHRLNDEEMIAYYSALIHSLGGTVSAYYLNGLAVWRHGKLLSYTEKAEEKRARAFIMVDHVVGKRYPGWPLEALSEKDFSWREKEDRMRGEQERRFLVEALQLKKGDVSSF